MRPNGAPTATTLSSSANPIVYGDTPTFTAVVSSNAGIPTGTVIFVLDGGDGLIYGEHLRGGLHG